MTGKATKPIATKGRRLARSVPPRARGARHVAFLRGINLGRRRVEMSVLRALFGELGLTQVSTFIASGNVLFSGAGERAELERRIGLYLETRLGYDVDTFVRSAEEVDWVATAQPFSPRDLAAPHDLHVLFLHEPLEHTTAARLEACRSEVDVFRVDGREIYWRSPLRMSDSVIWSSPAIKALRLPDGTMRNINTVRRIAYLLRSGRGV